MSFTKEKYSRKNKRVPPYKKENNMGPHAEIATKKTMTFDPSLCI
jgi:hypothetical protein